ncbi:MAG: hypothetical protein ACK4N5_08795, partial [Myxococcales bacterium]
GTTYYVVVRARDEAGNQDGNVVEKSGRTFLAPTVSFATDVQPIFNANCSGCHGGSGNLSLAPGSSHANLVNVPTVCNPSQRRVVPGDHLSSQLWLKVTNHANKCGGEMPAGSGTGLSAPDALKIEKWINEGALNN